DKMMRTLGLGRLAKRQYEQLAEPVRQSLQAYARGVNHWLATHRGALSPAFVLFDFTLEKWRPTDSLLWGKLMGLRLSRNWRRELLRYRLLDRLPRDKMRDLWPAMPTDDPVSISLSEMQNLSLNKIEQSFAQLDQLIGPFSEASNAWAISGKRTVSGKPILANDPHLGFSIPILWYLARIETPEQSLIGATVPGMPFHILGQNKNIAWGLTTTSGDTADLYIEKLDPKNSNQYLTPAGLKPFKSRTEIIQVSNHEPVEFTVRETRHGPVVSDLFLKSTAGRPTVLSFKATFLADHDQTPAAIYHLNRAKDWPTFLQALELFHAPQQNIMYADSIGYGEGNIGLVAAGRMPVRRHGQGWWPQAGWRKENDWPGYIPFNELPKTLNPPSGIIVNANNRIVDQQYPYYLSDDFAPGYRAARIIQELNRTDKKIGKQSVDSSARLQRDEVSLMAQKILPLMIGKLLTASLSPPLSTTAQSALVILKKWRGKMTIDSPAPLIF
ncbi:MAG: penicillin acylase family protein, partial [Rhodospirillales bacterium]